jgi:hypothetical protein
VPRLIRALLLIAGAAVLALLVRRVGARVIFDLLRHVGWAFAIVSAIYTAHLAVRAAALWQCLPPGSLAFAQVLRVRLSAEAVEMLTFTGPFLAEPAKGWLLARRGVTGADAFGAVAIEYLLYTLTSAWMAVIALSMLIARGVLAAGLRRAVIGVIAGMIAFSAAFAVAAVSGRGLLVPTVRRSGAILGRRRADAAAARVEPIERVLLTFIHDHPARLLTVLATEALGHLLLALEIFTVVRALMLPVRFLDTVVVEGAIKFISVAFFFVPGQVGAQEGVYTLLFQAIGVSGAVGLTMALVRRVRALIVAGAGVAVLALTGADQGPLTNDQRP